MTFSKILCPTDFSECSQYAIRCAARLAKAHHAELVVAHAWDVPPSLYNGGYTFSPRMLKQLGEDARHGVDDAVRDALQLGAERTTGEVANGSPWREMVELLERGAFDLCVLGTHGRSGLSRVLLGSVADKIIRHAPCSVLAVRDCATDTPAAFSHVLCPTDFSASADHALELALGLVAPGGTITLLHVLELPIGYAGEIMIEGLAQDLDRRSAEALEACAARLRRKSTVTVATRSRIGYPGAQILAMLEADPTIDLVVMGSHGRTGIKRVLLGSVAEKLVRHAGRPVLVARVQK